jgi:hypothetical protein
MALIKLHQINFNQTGSYTGSLLGTSSYSNQSLSSSYALTSSYSNQSLSSSYALTASYALNGGTTNIFISGSGSGSIITSSFNNSNTWLFNHNLGTRTPIITVFDSNYNQIIPQDILLNSISSSTIIFPTLESGFAVASVGGILDGEDLYFPYTGSAIISGSLTVTGSIITTHGFTGSLLGTSSYSNQSLSSSYALTASYASNGGVTQLLAGANISLSPTNGLGQITITSIGGSSGTGNTATGSYGSFYDTTTQTNPVGNIPRSMSLNRTDITNGVSISGSTNPFNTYIKTENPGVYNIQFSAQLDKTDSGTDEIVIWLRKNGINLIDTSTSVTLVGNNAKNVAAWNWFVNSAANDYYQIIWQSPDTKVRLFAEPADEHPGIPSVIVTANRVDQFLSNTGSFSGSFIGLHTGLFTGSFTGSLFGTSSWAESSSMAVSSSYSLTASFALNAGTTVNTSSFVTTSSFNTFTSSYTTGSFTGSFRGIFTGSLQGTSSFSSQTLSSSYSLTSSFTIGGELVSNKSNDIYMGGASPSSTKYTTEYAVNYFVSQSIAAAQSGIPLIQIDMFANYKLFEYDENGSTSYQGQTKYNNNAWLITKYVETGGDITATYANVSNNGSYTTPSTAWTARAVLNYTASIANLTGI